jgi:hypothetical protein
MGATGASGMGATGGEARGWGSASASGRSGGRIGGPTGADTGDLMPMATPMRTRPSLPCPPPSSMCNPPHRPPPSPRHPRIGTTAMRHGGTTPMSNNAQGDGGRSPPRRHKPEGAGARARPPARVSSVPRYAGGLDTSPVGVVRGAVWRVKRVFYGRSKVGLVYIGCFWHGVMHYRLAFWLLQQKQLGVSLVR